MVGVAAQSEQAESTSEEVFFGLQGYLGQDAGEYTAIGDIPGGSMEVMEAMFEPPNLSTTYRFDPDPPGDDTFKVMVNGVIRGQLESGLAHATLFWNVVPGSGTGEYADLAGKGRAFMFADPEAG